MKFHKTNIEGCFVINPDVIKDDRGGFIRVFCKDGFRDHIGEEISFTQINHSINKKKGTFRGMHYQMPPYCEGKLIRCVAGNVVDYFLDLRKGSPTFLKYSEVELSSENNKMIYLCKGVAHGFFTLEDHSALIYHHTENYHKDADSAIRYNDPMINIKLPSDVKVISERDQNHPLLTNNFGGLEL